MCSSRVQRGKSGGGADADHAFVGGVRVLGLVVGEEGGRARHDAAGEVVRVRVVGPGLGDVQPEQLRRGRHLRGEVLHDGLVARAGRAAGARRQVHKRAAPRAPTLANQRHEVRAALDAAHDLTGHDALLLLLLLLLLLFLLLFLLLHLLLHLLLLLLPSAGAEDALLLQELTVHDYKRGGLRPPLRGGLAPPPLRIPPAPRGGVNN